MVKIKNGIGKFRWNPNGYKIYLCISFKIKLIYKFILCVLTTFYVQLNVRYARVRSPTIIIILYHYDACVRVLSTVRYRDAFTYHAFERSMTQSTAIRALLANYHVFQKSSSDYGLIYSSETVNRRYTTHVLTER